jgi:hypothetical protein
LARVLASQRGHPTQTVGSRPHLPIFSGRLATATLLIAMTLLSPDQLVQQIHDSPMRIVLAASGGGSRAIADLLEVPGGSRTLLEAVVPYSPAAMVAWLGGTPDEFCSAATARAMAMAAFHRARRYEAADRAVSSGQWPVASGQGSGVRDQGPDTPNLQICKSPNSNSQSPIPSPAVICPHPNPLPKGEGTEGAAVAGIACTASLASDRPKHGPHRIHIALQTVSLTAAWHLQLQKDRRTREEEERLAGRMLLNVVAAACGIPERLTLELLEDEHVAESRTEAPPAWQDLLLGNVETVRVGPGEAVPRVVFPGAFNPLHDGHRRMIQLAQDILKQPTAVEIAIVNVDKPPLDYMEIERRLGQFPGEQVVYLSRAATFEAKSRLFAGATFVVGIDTLRRIGDPHYYGDSTSACESVIDQIAARGCRFLVFGRDFGTGFLRLCDLTLPEPLRAICREVPPEAFREDVSSTAIRKSGVR